MTEISLDMLPCSSKDDVDIHICGKCRRQFTDVSDFVQHKREHQQDSAADVTSLQLVEMTASQYEPLKEESQSEDSHSIHSDINKLMSQELKPSMLDDIDSCAADSLEGEVVYSLEASHLEEGQPSALDGMVTSAIVNSYNEQRNAEGMAGGVDISGGSTVSTTGNIQITLTPQGGLAVAMQSLPPTIQAALQSGLALNVVTTPGEQPFLTETTLDVPSTSREATSAEPTNLSVEPVISVVKPRTPAPHSKLNKKRKFQCTYEECGYSSNYHKDLDRHTRTHTGEKPFKCQLCEKSFNRQDKLRLHLRGHEGVKPHACPHCEYKTADKGSLKKHIRIHTDERPYQCQICPYASRNSSQLVIHLRTHTGDCPYVCYVCGAKFKINSDLKRHAMRHTGEKPFACNFCEYRTPLKCNLRNHIRQKHSAANSVLCQLCAFETSSQRVLKEHLKSHDPTPNLKCTQCIYTTSNRSQLKCHMRVHSIDRPYKCNFCAFRSKQNNITTHMRKKHPIKFKTLSRKARGNGVTFTEAAATEAGTPETEETEKLDGRKKAGWGGGNLKPICKKNFECPQCDSSFVREDSYRCHMKCHEKSNKMLAQSLESTAMAVLQLQYPVDNSVPTEDESRVDSKAVIEQFVVESPEHEMLSGSPEMDATAMGSLNEHPMTVEITQDGGQILQTVLVQSEVASHAATDPTPASTASTTQMTNQLLAYIQNNQNMAMEDNMQNQAISSRQAEQHLDEEELPQETTEQKVNYLADDGAAVSVLIPVSIPYSLAAGPSGFSHTSTVLQEAPLGQQWSFQVPQGMTTETDSQTQFRIIGSVENLAKTIGQPDPGS